MIYIFGFFIFLNTFLPKVGFEVKFLPFHLNVVDILYVLLLVYVVVKFFRLKDFARLYPLFILFLWGLFSALHGYFNQASADKVVDEFLRQYIYIFVALLCLFLVRTSDELDKVFFFFFVAFGLLSVYGFLQLLFGTKFLLFSKTFLLGLGYPLKAEFFETSSGYDRKIVTTLLCSNTSGNYLASGAILLLAKGLLDKKQKFIYIVIFFLSLTILIFTQSRGGLVGFFAGLCLFSVLVFKKKFWIFPAGLVIFLSIFSLFNYSIRARLKTFFYPMQSYSAWERVMAIKESLPIIKESPLTGYGLGMISVKKVPVRDATYEFPDRGKISAADIVYGGLDCFWAKYTVANGLIGLFIFLYSVFWLFRKFLIKMKTINITHNWVLVGSSCALVVLLTGAVFDSMLMVSTHIAMLFWFYYGLVLREIDENR